MKTLSFLSQSIITAENELRRLRDERSARLIDLAPKPGDEFESSGTRYKVYSVSAASKGNSVWLHCRYWTSSKKWSQGTKVLTHEVTED